MFLAELSSTLLLLVEVCFNLLIIFSAVEQMAMRVAQLHRNLLAAPIANVFLFL